MLDCANVAIRIGDRVMVTGWGSNIRLTDIRRKGTVIGKGRVRPIVEWDNATDTPNGNPEARMLSVLRRDGEPGFEANRG